MRAEVGVSRRRWIVLGLAVAGAGFGGLCSSCAHDGLAEIDSSALALQDTQGERVRLGAYQGRVVLLNFFATWCFECVGDVPRLEALQEERAKDGLQVVGVGLDREGSLVLEPFRQYYHLTYPVLVGAERFGQVGLPFAPVTVVPTTFVIGRDGRVLGKWEGVLPQTQFERVVDAALRDH